MKIEVELTEEEEKLFLTFCLLRVTTKAIEVLEFYRGDDEDDDVDMVVDDLSAAGPMFESVRQKIANALLSAKAEARKIAPGA